MDLVFACSIWILFTCICKIGLTKLKKSVDILPESALQIIIGLVLGGIFYWINLDTKYYIFDAHIFFAFLLPPIIFDAGYFMPNRDFFDNFDSIMVFAVIGTVFNTFAIGLSLSLMNIYGLFTLQSTSSQIFLFSSLISAVDPVAVIAVFEEMNINKPLFVTVFGEALFNDAISIVLFAIFKSFVIASETIQTIDYFLGFVSFFVIAIGGVFIGIISALICAFITKFTSDSPSIVTLIVFISFYIGYVVCEIFGFSSLISAAVCGMCVRQYLKINLESTCYETIGIVSRNLAISSESLTFILLGLAVVSIPQYWDTVFVLSTIVFCLIFRFVAIFGLSYILKRLKNKKIKLKDQLMLSFGGLRGAIAFGIVVSMSDDIESKKMFITATLAVIFFSVIVQGLVIKPLIRILKIDILDEEECENGMALKTVGKSIDHIMQVVEISSSQFGIHRIREIFNHINNHYIVPIITTKSA